MKKCPYCGVPMTKKRKLGVVTYTCPKCLHKQTVVR